MARMRVLISGGATREGALIAAALAGSGFVIAEAGTPFDLRLTLGQALSERLSRGGLTLDPARREATRAGRNVRLTGIECALLATLMRADAPLGKDALLHTVWGYSFDPGTNVVAVHISRLRSKIGADAIVYTRDGYQLV
jgi:DNA-binding response OmpR family regulator